MFFAHLLTALFFALLLSIFFGIGLRRRGPWPNFWVYFLIIFLAVWAGGIWIAPTGPVAWGVNWVPFLLVGLLVVLMFAAVAIPEPPPRTKAEAIEQAQVEQEEAAVLGVFFWVMIVGFLVAILARYFF